MQVAMLVGIEAVLNEVEAGDGLLRTGPGRTRAPETTEARRQDLRPPPP